MVHALLADVEGLFQNDVLPHWHVLLWDSVTKWNLDRTVPSAIAEIVVAAGEEIPCYHDLRPIFETLEKAFYNEGMSSLCLQILYTFERLSSKKFIKSCLRDYLQIGKQQIVRYHFSKLRLIVNYNNHEYNLLVAKRLLDHVHDSNLLSPNLIAELKLNRFAEPLAGFKVTETPLYTLGSLLDERWVLEDVLNARAEFLY
ncbi:SF3b1 domain-containing protein, partial [Favolaschia claudopus]